MKGLYRLPERSFSPSNEVASCTSASLEKRVDQMEFLERKSAVEQALNKRLSKELHRCALAEQALRAAESWKQEAHRAELLKANFRSLKRGVARITVEDWEREGEGVELELDPALTPEKQLQKFFQRARKLQRSLPHRERQLASRIKEVEAAQKALQEEATLSTL